jgi:beta-glucuronidase
MTFTRCKPGWPRILILFASLNFANGYWPHYGGDRRVEQLDGLWNTSKLGSIENPPLSFDSLQPKLDPSAISTPDLTNVPSCVDNTPPWHFGYRGVSFFRRKFRFNLTETGARIQFQACSFYCRVWVNGIEIGDHRAGGYVAFSLDIPSQNSIDNEIFVLVDNRFNKTTAPLHTGGDFWHYGGIMRSVELHALPPKNSVWPWRLYALPDSLSTVHLSLHLTFQFNGPLSDILISFDNGPFVEYAGIATNGILDLGTVAVPAPRVWSTVNPQLHTVQVKLNGAIVVERFGLRVLDIDPHTARIRLNGKVLKLVGWNHHTQWPDTAASPTDEQLDQDILLLKQGGANFVRGAHYPQDPRWLDRLDENGLIMWCETLGPNVSVQNTQDAVFLKYQAKQVNEMLDNALNHASIAFWAFFNEGPSNVAEACQAYQESSDIIHSRDSTRFVSYASNKRPPSDKCYAAADVLSINGYPDWYNKGPPNEFWDRIANDLHAGNPPEALGKPFLISETGAGGIYEWSENETAALWTLAYQNEVLNADVDAAIANPNVSGICLWHFFDFKVNDQFENNTYCDYIPGVYPPTCGFIHVDTSSPNGRPGGENHKGVLDFWRRKKPSFDRIATKYNATKHSKDIQMRPLSKT